MFDDAVDCAICQSDDIADCDAVFADCQLACDDDGGPECYDDCFADYCVCIIGIGCDPAEYDCT
jgi:hypothetical protein